MSLEDLRESRKIVRMYSWDVEERIPPESDARHLRQCLIETRDDSHLLTSPWREFFERQELSQDNRHPLTEVIAVESANLRERWVAFHKQCPKDERLDLTKSEPTMESVADMVQGMVEVWNAKREQGRRGKALSLFHRFCSKLDSHSSMMKLLPEGNAYVSVFMGTLGAIIKASVNHEHIAEEFASALCQISEHIIWCKLELDLFHTKFMLEQIADLYAQIFLFFSSIMDWILEKRRRRLLDSFNEHFNKRFENEITNINHKAEAIRRRAEYSSRAELRALRLDMENVGRDVRIGLEGMERFLAERQYFEEQMMKKEFDARKERELTRTHWALLGNQVNQMLLVEAMESNHRNQMMLISLAPAPVMGQGVENMVIQPVAATQSGSDQVLLNSKDLEDFFHRDRLRLSIDFTAPVMVNQDALAALSEWLASTTRRALWLEGPPLEADDEDNPVTMVAARIIDMAAQSKVPVISYFCELRRGETLRAGNTSETQAMLSLLYALIRQLVELLLPRFETDVDLSESRFKLLDGTLGSWEDAMGLFRDLLELGPDPIFCVIDGFHWLDDRSTEPYLYKFARVLQEGRVKVLFTTTGRSACLSVEVPVSDTVEVQTGRPGDDYLEIDIMAST